MPATTNTPRGLTTLALLKTRFDEKKDHLGLLEPFVADAVLAANFEHFSAADLQAPLRDRCGLNIPVDTIGAVLHRLVHSRLVGREGGRYHRGTPPLEEPIPAARRAAIEAQYSHLGDELVRFAEECGVRFDTHDDALTALTNFVSDNKVPLVLHEDLPDSPIDRSALPRKITRTLARFVREHCLSSVHLTEALEGLIEGMVLQDALLFRDIASLSYRFENLWVYLDTAILFAALDLTGIANGLAAKEGLVLLRDTGAVTAVFDRTISEMKRILQVYEDRLGTSEGRLSLYPTDLTRHALTAKLTPGDIRTISSTMERRLGAIGIVIREVPKHDRRYTLDEVALAQRLADPSDPKGTTSPRVRHDTDCVAGVLTLRKGQRSTSVERSRAIFSTTSGRVIRNVHDWFSSQEENGAQPIVHQSALTSLAWLKRPASAKGLMLHELAAVCAAALRPTRATWRTFTENLQQLRLDGVISDDEAVAVVASELTEPLLSKIDDDHDPDADTVLEAIDRVRATYREQAEASAAIAIDAAREEVVAAQQAATDAIRNAETVTQAVHRRLDRIASALASVGYAIGVIVLVLAMLASIPGMLDSIEEEYKWLARIVLLLAGLIGGYLTICGPTWGELRDGWKRRIAAWLRRWFLPP